MPKLFDVLRILTNDTKVRLYLKGPSEIGEVYIEDTVYNLLGVFYSLGQHLDADVQTTMHFKDRADIHATATDKLLGDE